MISPQVVFGGAATANISIAKMLTESGNDVIYNDEYMEANIYNGVFIDHTPIHSVQNKAEALLKLVDDNSIDTIIWGTINISIYYPLLIYKLKKRGIKQIGLFHSLCLESNIKSRLVEFAISQLIRYFDYYVFVSKYTERSWCKYRNIRKSKEKLISIFNPMAKAANSYTLNSIISVGYVGRFSEEKQPELFCKLSVNTDFRYVAYGDGPLQEDLKKRYPDIIFRGNCMDTDKIYNDIDILIMTSKFENCPMVILEAKSRGIPCIAPNVGGIPEIVQSGVDGELYDTFKVESIYQILDKIKNNYSYYSCNCLKMANQFQPESIKNKWLDII